MAAQVVPGTGDAALFKEAAAALFQTLHTHCNVGFLCFSKCVERTARYEGMKCSVWFSLNLVILVSLYLVGTVWTLFPM